MPTSVWYAVPFGSKRSSAVGMCVWVPKTAVTLPSKCQPMATFSLVASAWKSTKITLAVILSEQVVGGVERIVGAAHEDLAHEVQDRVRQAHAGPRGNGSFVDAMTGQAGLHIRGSQDAACPIVAVGRDRGEVVEKLALVPDMIAGGHHVGAEVEQFVGDLRGHAKAAGGVLDVHDGQIDLVGLADVANVLTDDPAPRAAEDVADEEDVQRCSMLQWKEGTMDYGLGTGFSIEETSSSRAASGRLRCTALQLNRVSALFRGPNLWL